MVRFAVLLLALGMVQTAHAQSVPPPPAAKAKPAARKPAQPKTESAAVPAGGRCIGVFPLLGDRFEVKKIGLMVFGNEEKVITVTNWGLDDVVVERLRAAVGPNIAVRRIAYAKDAFAGYTPGIGVFQNVSSKPPDIVRQAAGQNHCERYVVVTPGPQQLVGNQNIFGVGIVNTGRPIRSATAIHTTIRIHVHDGQSFAVLKSGIGSLSGGNYFTATPASKQVDESWWPEPPEAANTPKMRDAVRALLAEALDKSLPEFLAQ